MSGAAMFCHCAEPDPSPRPKGKRVRCRRCKGWCCNCSQLEPLLQPCAWCRARAARRELLQPKRSEPGPGLDPASPRVAAREFLGRYPWMLEPAR